MTAITQKKEVLPGPVGGGRGGEGRGGEGGMIPCPAECWKASHHGESTVQMSTVMSQANPGPESVKFLTLEIFGEVRVQGLDWTNYMLLPTGNQGLTGRARAPDGRQAAPPPQTLIDRPNTMQRPWPQAHQN